MAPPRPSLVSAGGQTVTRSVLTNQNFAEFNYASLEEAFPTVNPQHEPFGAMVLLQIRLPKRKTAGGIRLAGESQSTEYYNTQTGKVIALGPLAFKSIAEGDQGNPDRIVDWPEGAWFNVGDFVRAPKYGGDRFAIPYSYQDNETNPETGRPEKVTVKTDVIFALFKAKDIIAKVTGDPLKVKAFFD